MVSSNRRILPGFFSTLGAFLALAAYCAVAVAGLFVTHEFRLEGVSGRVADDLQQGQIAKAKVTLRETLDSRSLDTQFVRFIEGPQSNDSFELMLKYVQIAENVRSGQLARIITSRSWIENEAPLPEGSKSKQQLIDLVTTAQANIQKIEFEISNRKEMTRTAEQLAKEYLVIAQRFGALLSLQPVVPTPGVRTLPVSERGFLEGLPQLAKLTQEITDVEHLAAVLPSIGGKVTVEGQNAAAAFDSELAAIRALTSSVVQSRNELRDAEDRSDRERERLKKELEAVAKSVVQAVSKEIPLSARKRPEWYERLRESEGTSHLLGSYAERVVTSVVDFF